MKPDYPQPVIWLSADYDEATQEYKTRGELTDVKHLIFGTQAVNYCGSVQVTIVMNDGREIVGELSGMKWFDARLRIGIISPRIANSPR